MVGVDGNPWTLLNINTPFGPPENGYASGTGKVYQACGALQWRIGAVQDGRWGPQTRSYLQTWLWRNNTLAWNWGDVVALQHHLTDVGFPCAADGSFGPATAKQFAAALNSTRF